MILLIMFMVSLVLFIVCEAFADLMDELDAAKKKIDIDFIANAKANAAKNIIKTNIYGDTIESISKQIDLDALFNLLVLLSKSILALFILYYIWWFRKDRFLETLHYYSLSETKLRRERYKKEQEEAKIRRDLYNKTKIKYVKPESKKDIFYKHINKGKQRKEVA